MTWHLVLVIMHAARDDARRLRRQKGLGLHVSAMHTWGCLPHIFEAACACFAYCVECHACLGRHVPATHIQTNAKLGLKFLQRVHADISFGASHLLWYTIASLRFSLCSLPTTAS